MEDKIKKQLLNKSGSKSSIISNNIFSAVSVVFPPKQADMQITDPTLTASNLQTRQNINNAREEESLFCEMNLEKESLITFSLKNKQEVVCKKELVLSACPIIANHKEFDSSQKKINILVPDWVNAPMIKEFFIYFEDENHTNFTISTRQLLLMSDYFDNQVLVSKIILNEIIPYLNISNCLPLLEDSYLKLHSKKTKNKVWFDLFYECLNFSGKNLAALFLHKENKLTSINNKVLEEIIEK